MCLYYYVKKMKNWPRNGRKQPRKGAKVSESESKRPDKTFLYRLHSCTHEQECKNRKILAPQCDPLTLCSAMG